MPRARPDEPRLKLIRGKYYVEWWDAGERRRLSTGTADPKRAQQALADFQHEQAASPSHQTVRDALDRYLKNRRSKVEAVERMEQCAAAISAGLGGLRIEQVNQTQWDRYSAQRVTKPGHNARDHVARPVSTGTLRREFNVLRAALRQAWKDGHLIKPPPLEPPQDSAPRDRYLTKEEARRLLNATVTPHVRAFLAIALFTGARKGSILSLTWDRVNFATGMIDFQEPGRRITKKRRAVVPMGEQLRAEIEAAYALRSGAFVVQYNGNPVPSGLRWSFARLCTRAQLDWKPTPHHIKHSVASWMAMEGVPIDQAADWLATDPLTLRKTYRKFDPTYLRSVAGALAL